MRELAVGFSVNRDKKYPPRGERIAAWVESYLARAKSSAPEFAFRVGVDRRDIRRLLAERTCGPRLNDALEEAFGHDFMDAVAAPVVGGDRITVLEREIASERARIAALDARLARERSARLARDAAADGQLRLLPQEERSGLS